MANNLPQTFNFHNNQVRIIKKDSEPWFVAADVCDILGIKNPTMSLKYLDNREKAKFDLGYGSPANIISKSGLYKLIMRSDKPEAKAFQNWVTGEVLPAIRKTGSYSVQPTEIVHAQIRGSNSPDYAKTAELAAQAAKAVFEAMLKDNQPWLNNTRFSLSMNYDHKRGQYVPTIKPIPHDAYIASMERFTQMIKDGAFKSNKELTGLVNACVDRLSKSMSW